MPLNELQRRQKEAAKKRRQRERKKLRELAAAQAAEDSMAEPENAPVVYTPNTAMLDLELINATRLAQLLGRSEQMVRVDASRRPQTLPPRFVIPGMRKLLWRMRDVREWMDELSAAEAARRAAISAEARAPLHFPAVPSEARLSGTPYSRAAAAKATEQLAAKRAKAK